MRIGLILDSRLSTSKIAELGILAEQYGVNSIWLAIE